MTTGVAGPHRRSSSRVGGVIGIFNAVVVGIAGLYAGTGSLWVTAAAGVLAAGLAALYLLTNRDNHSIAVEGPAAIPSLDRDATRAPEGSDEENGAPAMDDDSITDNHEQFAAFFRAEYPRVVYAVARMGAPLAEAEDAAEDALTGVYLRWGDLANPAAYARKSAVNAYLARVRAQRRETPVDLDRLPEESMPDDDLEIAGAERRVLEVLAKLPRAQRAVMTMVYAGFTTAEIAREVGTSEAGVRSNLRHARDRLRELLAAEDLF